MSPESDRVRRQYTSDVVGAVFDYLERGGQLSFRSQRDGTTLLAIRFVFDDVPLFDASLGVRMAASDELGTGPIGPTSR